MKPPNKKAPGVRGVPRPFKQQAPQFKPVVAQLKTPVSAQSVKHPIAPPVYRPGPRPMVMQAKTGLLAKHTRPQTAQSKMAQARPPVIQRNANVAPATHCPHPRLQTVQPRTSSQANGRKQPVAPPVYRPQPTPKVLQAKPAGKAIRQPQPPRITRAASASRQASVVQRVRSSFNPRLPPEVKTDLKVDDVTPQKDIDRFVDGLDRSKMKWYESDNPRADTQTYVLYLSKAKYYKGPNPFGPGILELWECPNCRQPTTYSGIHLGHKTDWKLHLKRAGVTNMAEAQAAYNDLNNVRVECATCNVGHAFEKDSKNNFKDVPLLGDFPRSAEGRKRHAALVESYGDADLDSHEREDVSMDESEEEELILLNVKPVTLAQDFGAIDAGSSETFAGGARLKIFTKTEYKDWVKVQVIDSGDPRLPEGTVAWAKWKHLGKMAGAGARRAERSGGGGGGGGGGEGEVHVLIPRRRGAAASASAAAATPRGGPGGPRGKGGGGGVR